MSGSLTETYLIVLVGAGTVLALGISSGFIKNKLWISEPLIATGVGIAVGPIGLNLITHQITTAGEAPIHEVARVTLALAVLGAALRVTRGFLAAHWRDLTLVLTLGMVGMAAVSALLASIFFHLPLLTAALVGAVLSPTDPVLAAAVVTGKVAERGVHLEVRDALSAESGANDGLALLLVALPLLVLQHPLGEAIEEWLLTTFLHEIGVALFVGISIGWLGGKAFMLVKEHPLSEHSSIITISLALAITVLSATRVLGADGILAVFLAGLIFGHYVDEHGDTHQEPVQEAYTRFFELPVFIFVGAALPWDDWHELGLPLLGFAVSILFLRRLPLWLVLRGALTAGRSMVDVAVAGWFGPIGIAALFYSSYAIRHDAPDILWPIVSGAVFLSIIMHGVTATPVAAWIARRRSEDFEEKEKPPRGPQEARAEPADQEALQSGILADRQN